MSNKKAQYNKGYSLIETMVAISIFMIIVTTGVAAILNVNYINRKTKDMRSIMDNLSFIMEEMSRNIRTGYNYHCELAGSPLSNITTPASCQLGYAIAFEEARGDQNLDSDQWVYRVQGYPLKLSKSIDGGVTFTDLNVPEITLDSNSGFMVLGAPPPGDPYRDTNQPMVVIRLSGKISHQGIETPFSLQTTVTQRVVDVD